MAEWLLCWQDGQGSAHWCQHTGPSARLGVFELSGVMKKGVILAGLYKGELWSSAVNERLVRSWWYNVAAPRGNSYFI